MYCRDGIPGGLLAVIIPSTMGERIRGFRGATTLDEDTREQLLSRTGALIRAMLERNELSDEDLVSIIFTATPDIRADFPAAAAREIGLRFVPLLCAREIDAVEGVSLCVRILMHAYSTRGSDEVRHVYLERARPLRADLPD